MVTETKCDICGKPAYKEGVHCCTGYMTESGNKKYKPFEQPNFGCRDLCYEHYIKWCKATYSIFYGKKD